MSMDFDGVDDDIRWADNILNIDFDKSTITMHVQVDAQSGTAIDAILVTGAAIAAGNLRSLMGCALPVTAGWKFEFRHAGYATQGRWEYATDLLLDRDYYITVTYDRSSTANDPKIYINGRSVAVTELAAPAGALSTGIDSVIIGRNVASNIPLNGMVAEAAIWSDLLLPEEVFSLASGGVLADARTIRPAALRFYAPLAHATDRLELVRGVVGTLSSAPVPKQHPKIKPFLPMWDLDWMAKKAVAAGDTLFAASLL